MAARSKKKQENTAPGTPERSRWAGEIDRAVKRYEKFCKDGDDTVNRYRLERENVRNNWMDKYNILYSSTETIRPSLYAQTPKVQATKRHRDRENPKVTMATMLLEVSCQYALEEIDFDEVMGNVVGDYILPGMGNAWVRYEPQFTGMGEGEDAYEALTFEGLALDYVYYKDFLTSEGRTEQDIWWKGRRVYFDKEAAKRRFGEQKAARLSYSYTKPDPDGSGRNSTVNDNGDQAIIYEIWNKRDREVIWYSPDYPDDVLDKKADPLKLKNFYPCPRSIRAVYTTDTYVPQAFYSQYRQQADTLDDLTQRIRHLTKALRVVGVYDSSQESLQKLLTGTDNRMVPVENWAQFAGNNGINGSIQFLPIQEIAATLTQMYQQREIAKAEIYEITGFSDIVRGVSKASETLGAQQIKNDWAGGRLRAMQKEVQRFCRDVIRIFAEVISEQFSDESLAMYAGFEPPEVTEQEQQAVAQHAVAALNAAAQGQPAPPPPPPTAQQQAIQQFTQVVDVIREEKTRCALIGIETDSTITPDEAQERKDRLEFLGQIGAFLQQAGPMALQYPDMRGLLGAIMMFAVRTFRASRPIEKEFEAFTKQLAEQPPMPPPGKEGEGGQQKDPQAEAQAKAQVEQLKLQGQQSMQSQDLQMEKYKVDKQEETKRLKMQQDHEKAMAEIRIKERELTIKEAELGIKYQQEERAEENEQFQQDKAVDDAARADRQLEQQADAAAQQAKAKKQD